MFISRLRISSVRRITAPGEAPSSDSYLRFLFARAGTYYIGVSSIEGTYYDPVTGLHDAIRQAGTGGYVLRVNRLP